MSSTLSTGPATDSKISDSTTTSVDTTGEGTPTSPTFISTVSITLASTEEAVAGWKFWTIFGVAIFILLALLGIGICLFLVLQKQKKARKEAESEDTKKISGKKLEEGTGTVGAVNNKTVSPVSKATGKVITPQLQTAMPNSPAKETTKTTENPGKEPSKTAPSPATKVTTTPTTAKPPPTKTVVPNKTPSKTVDAKKNDKENLLDINELEKQLGNKDGIKAMAIGGMKLKEDEIKKKSEEENKEEITEEEEEVPGQTKVEQLMDVKVYDDHEKAYDNLTQFTNPGQDQTVTKGSNSGGSSGAAPMTLLPNATLNPEPTLNPSFGGKVSNVSKVSAKPSIANPANAPK